MTTNFQPFLIADSGSTKTDWRLVIPDGKIISFTTAGFNPFFWASEQITDEINHKVPVKVKVQISKSINLQVFFYGAGCSSAHRCTIISIALKKCFPGSKISVNHDLLGAARALFGRRPGIAAILGTGSNSCQYDGEKIVDNIPALGYVLGDDGSGAHIGKLFLRSYLYRELPANLAKQFENETGLDKEKILTAVYNRPLPNRFLASFGKFIYRHSHDPYLRKLVRHSFDEFITHHIFKYRNHRKLPFGCVGSIGYHFRSILKAAAAGNKLHLTGIIESPVDHLVKYHTGK